MADRIWKFREDMLGYYINGVSNLTFQDAEDRLNYLENTLGDLVAKYEGYLKSDENKNLDEYDQGEHNELLAVVTELKELFYKDGV